MFTKRKTDVLYRDEKILKLNIGNNALTGMTSKFAGNFATGGEVKKAFDNAKKALLMINPVYISQIGKIPLIVMGAQEHTDKVLFFYEPNNHFINTETNKLKLLKDYNICDGVIFKGTGMAFFYPGGCAAIAFRDDTADLTGLLHGGWIPVTKGIVNKFLNKWEKAGGRPENTEIVFLPSICGTCLDYDSAYFRKNVLPRLVSLFLEKGLSDGTARKRAKEFFTRFPKKKEKINFHVNFLIEDLLHKAQYYEITRVEECTCGAKCERENRHWCYRCNDVKDGQKYRNAAYIINT